ncbi:MAG TPA: DUF1592 domain-containing protein [Gammaproteobacteria bacterium]
MRYRAVAAAGVGLALIAGGYFFHGASRKSTEEAWALFDSYCVDCHNRIDLTANIAFDALDPASVPHEPEIFEKAVRKLRARMMPPPGAPQPEQAGVDALVEWLESTLDAAAESDPHPGRVALHRLNRKEYENAVEDLLALPIDASEMLPRDERSDGFDNVASVLQVTPSFLNQYVSAAREVAVLAVGEAAPTPGSKQYFRPADAEGKQTFHVDGLPLGTRGGWAVEHWFPADGEYEINIQDMIQDIYFLGTEHYQTVLVTLDGAEIYRTHIGGPDDLKWIDQDQSPAADAIRARLKGIRFETTAGPHDVGVTFLARSFAESDSRLSPLVPGGGMDRLMRVTGFEVRGPFAPTGLSPTPSRERIFSCYPEHPKDERPCAERILARLARLAYRRPLTDSDLDVLLEFYDSGARHGGFEEGVRAGITRMLASPHFLYRAAVPRPENRVTDSIYRLTDLELASRLSFFLWSSIPDDELLTLAEAGRLRDPGVLEAQIERMLASPKAKTLASNFAYQWLGLSKLDEIDPDPNVYPYAANHRSVVGIDGDIREEFVEEVTLFVDSILRDDRSIVDLLTADHTFLNERLAVHYGINTVKGDRFRRVTLEDPARWGLLGKGAVLMVTSYPNRTAPVLRGAWILENIIGAPPAPPPPEVEALLTEIDPATKVFPTVRARLEEHRSQPSCNGCHGVMDPLGFALENFNGVGVWRDVEEFTATPIDSTGQLPDGTVLEGPKDLREALVRRPEQFVQTFVEKLMTYALGRRIEYYDMPTVREIVRHAEENGYRFSSIVAALVRSDPFQLYEIEETPADAEILSVATTSATDAE